MATDRIKTIFDDTKMRLTARPVEQGCRPPQLAFGTYQYNPQLTVFTNCDNGSGVTIIGAGYNPATFFELLDKIEFLATEGVAGMQMECATLTEIPKEKRTDPKQKLEATKLTQIGRDENDCIWISIQDAKNSAAPKIRFTFQKDYYHNWKYKNIQNDKSTQSRDAAIAWVRMMRAMVGPFMVNNPNAATDAENAKQRWLEKNGNKGGYGNKGGNNNYGNKGGNNNYGNKGNSNYGSGSKPAAATSDGFDSDFDDGDFDD